MGNRTEDNPTEQSQFHPNTTQINTTYQDLNRATYGEAK